MFLLTLPYQIIHLNMNTITCTNMNHSAFLFCLQSCDSIQCLAVQLHTIIVPVCSLSRMAMDAKIITFMLLSAFATKGLGKSANEWKSRVIYQVSTCVYKELIILLGLISLVQN